MSIIENAMSEMERANFSEEERTAMREILEKFFKTWDSGGAVFAMAPVMMRLIAGQPLTPLTGDPDEWYEPVPGHIEQNKRCSSVFKVSYRDGDMPKYRSYDIYNTAWDGTFPYDPVSRMPADPRMEVTKR